MSDGFSTDWLALREPFDRAARAGAPIHPGLLAGLRQRADGRALQVVALGCGTGANLREIAPRLGGAQSWRLVDHDAQLLAALPGALAPWAAAHGLRLEAREALLVLQGDDGLRIEITRCLADLAGGPEAAPLAGADLVTASALLDLVSAPWLEALLARCIVEGAAMWWALNVDHRVDWVPHDPDDEPVLAQFRAHQARDKGFGPALGAAAAARVADVVRGHGWQVALTPCDWHVDGQRGARDVAMLRAMVEGIGDAATEQAPPEWAARIAAWQARRLAQLDGLQLRVGHADVQAWPN
ncbi:MAG: hypothetical protein EOO24_33535 [Comamonadaceae bacterium]|nr:MAG: hypothetical protein EOO24_33535 [Comamonadaceae bacterium]